MRVVRALLVLFVVLGALAASLISFDRPSPLASGTEPARPLRLAVVGDSLSAGASRYLGNGLDDGTWITTVVGEDVEFVGGWARSGATPERMAEHVRPVADVDVLVILAGTNAVRLHRSLADEAASYRSIVETVRPRSVLVAAIPPYHWQPAAAVQYNRDLRRLTREEGWTWGDPWGFARDGSGWVPGVSADGTHPTGPAQYRRLGLAMRELIEGVDERDDVVLAAE